MLYPMAALAKGPFCVSRALSEPHALQMEARTKLQTTCINPITSCLRASLLCLGLTSSCLPNLPSSAKHRLCDALLGRYYIWGCNYLKAISYSDISYSGCQEELIGNLSIRNNCKIISGPKDESILHSTEHSLSFRRLFISGTFKPEG